MIYEKENRQYNYVFIYCVANMTIDRLYIVILMVFVVPNMAQYDFIGMKCSVIQTQFELSMSSSASTGLPRVLNQHN